MSVPRLRLARIGSESLCLRQKPRGHQKVSPRVLLDGSALRNLARASRARGEFAFHLTKQLSLRLFLKRLQHKFQDEASYGNDCACN